MSDTYDIRYPDVEVELVGHDSNAFAIMGTVATALKRHGVPAEAINEFRGECMSGDYDYLIQTCMRWVDVT